MDCGSFPEVSVSFCRVADERFTEKRVLLRRGTGNLRRIMESVVKDATDRSRHIRMREISDGIWTLEYRAMLIGVFILDAMDFKEAREILRNHGVTAEFFEPVLSCAAR